MTATRTSSHLPPRSLMTHFASPYSTGVVMWLIKCILLLNVSTDSAGVTHWKLTDNDIMPVSPPSLETHGKAAAQNELSPSPVMSEDLYGINHLSNTDPEFSILIRYSARTSDGSGSLNRGSGGGHGIFRRSHSSCYSSGDVGDDENSDGIDGSTGPEGSGGGGGGSGSGGGGGGGGSGSGSGGGGGGGGGSGSGSGSGGGGPACQRPRVRDSETKKPRNPDGSGPMSPSDMASAQPSPLTCGEPVEYTIYDFLKGIARRNEHKLFPEPEVAMIFKKADSDNTVDLFDVEMGLRRAYQENPQSLTVLNQIGNFWRIKGHTQHAIECFRKALHISSDHPDLLLNLARVLFNLKFHDDAVFLAKRSLHMKSSDNHAWLQYFTLGEVYKALEKYEEASFYFKKSLEMNPSLHVAEMHLHELGLDDHHSVNAYTLLIILALILIVLIMIYYLIGAMST